MGLVRVDPGFQAEYPDGDTTCTEAYASLIRVGQSVAQLLDRAVSSAFEVPLAVATALAVVDGSPDPLTPSQIAERTLVASATMTATLDQLERRGWVRRLPNPDDRRSVLVEITGAGQEIADRLLAGIRAVEISVMGALDHAERTTFLDLLDKALARVAAVEQEPPAAMDGRRNRPDRLGHGH